MKIQSKNRDAVRFLMNAVIGYHHEPGTSERVNPYRER
jgi:hypothetical protein